METDNVIPKEALEEFKELYQKRFRTELSEEEAYRRASKLLDLYKLIYNRNYENNSKRNANKC